MSRSRLLNVGFGSDFPGNATVSEKCRQPSAGVVSSTRGRHHAPRPPAWHCQGPRSPLGASRTVPQMLCSDPKRSFCFLSEKTSSVLRKHRQGDQTQAGLLRCRLLRTGVSYVPAGEFCSRALSTRRAGGGCASEGPRPPGASPHRKDTCTV